MIELATIGICIILAGLTIFQLALIAGAPIGKYAWGGAHRILPGKLRAGSVVAIVLYAVFAIMALEKANFTNIIGSDMAVKIGVWIIAAYSCLATLMNAISKSKYERRMTWPTLLISILFIIIALG